MALTLPSPYTVIRSLHSTLSDEVKQGLHDAYAADRSCHKWSLDVSVRPAHVDIPSAGRNQVVAGFQRCGNNLPI